MGRTMADHISLGKNGNTGKIDFSRIKAGVKKEELVKNDARLESVFDMVDADKDGTLNRTELDELEKLVSDLAGDDGNLDNKEVKNFGEQKLGRKDRKALLEFLNKLDGVTPESVEKVETKLVSDKQVEVVTFKDGHTEEYYPNGQRISEVVQGNKKTKTTEMNGTVTSEVVTENEGEENEIISTTSTVNGQKQTVINNKGDKTTTTINYSGDKKSDATIVDENSTSVITYDSDGNPAKEVETSGTTEKTYIYQNGQKVLQSVIENKGLEGKETTKAYDNEGGYTQTKEVGNGKITTIVDKDGKVTSNVKTEKVNGQEVSLQLGKDGNIPGVIVQNGESPAAIAKKFGCSVDELMRLNADQLKGKGKNQYFEVGSEIKLPNTVGIKKFAKSQEGRKPAEVAKAEYARDAEIRRQKAEAERQRKAEIQRQQVAEKAYYQKLGVKSFNNKGKKVQAQFRGGKKTNVEIIGQLGYERQLVKLGNKLYTMSHDGILLDEGYLQAHKAFVSKPQNQRNNTASGIKNVTYVKDNNGKVWYFDEKTGKAIVKRNYTQIVKQESAFVANQLHTAAKGMGTDEELLEKGVKNIYSRDILQGVNAELRTKDSDYAGDAQTMPVEALILDEMSHTAARPLFKTLINSGTMTTQEQAHTVKREIEYEVHGGLTGYTSTSDLNEIMQLCSDRDLRLEVEAQFKKDHPELAENDGSVVRSYIAGDGWNAQEVDQFDANWVKTGAYQEARYVYQTDENGNVVLDKNGQPVVVIDEGDQAHRNGVIGRLVFDYQDKEALNKGLDAVNENPNSFDYQYLDQRASEEIAKDPQGKYQSRFTNQDNVQRYLAGFHSDETGTVDAGNVSASNTCLFKGIKPARVQAEEALYNAKNGDYSQTFDSMDSETYSAMAELVANGDIKGVKNMTDLYNKALNGATTQNDKTKIKANAMLSGQVNFTDEQIADFCVELMHSIDANKGRGGSTGMSAGYTNDADYQTEQLKAILQNNPQVMDAVKARVEKENFSYTTTIQSGGGEGQQPITTTTTTNTKESYMQLLADTKTIATDEIFYDAHGNKITDPQQIQQVKNANMQSLEQMRQYVAELERDYKKGIDAEGTLSDMANGLSAYSGIGTDREDVATEYRNAKLMLQQFEAAAQGKLRDSQGNVISAQDLAQQMLDKQNALAETNSDYKQTIAYGKMGIVLAPVIVATTVASGGAAAAGWGTLGVAATGGVAAGATTYGVNVLEYNTSYTGNTAEAREQNLEDSIVNGATTAIGIGQMKYIGSMANKMGTVARTGIRLGTTVAADTGVGAAAEYATTGNISAQGTMTNMIMSGVGNAIGARSLGKKQPAPNMHPRDGVYLTQDAPVTGRNEIADAEVARNIDQSHLNGRDREMIAREMEAQGTPTPQELDAYAKEHAYQAPTAEERTVLDAHQEQVRSDYSEAHRIENNATIKEQKAPTTPLGADEAVIKNLENEVGALDGQIKQLNKQLAGAKRANQMGRKNGDTIKKLEAQIEALQQKRTAKATELETARKSVEVKVEDVKPEIKPNEEAPVSNRATEGVQKTEVKTENVINDVNSIDASEIPSQHQKLWQNCKERIEKLTQELSMPNINSKELITRGKELLTSLKTIVNSATGAIKAKIESLYNDIRVMLNNAKKQIQNTHVNDLSAKQKEAVYTLREIYHSDLDDVATLRMDYPQYSYMSDKELLDFFKLDEKHAAFVKNRKDLFANGDAKYMERAYWNDSPYELTNNHSAWKMHLYSVDELDYQQMAEVVLPYLNKHKIAHKTLSSTMSPELLAKTAPEQTGKAFTIYPQSQEEMAQIAKDLDKLIREHNLTTNTSHITGDNQLGNSGRLFYRYEFPTGKLKDRIYTPGERAPYDANRGEGQYLAYDMTPADDPWLNFDPSNPQSVPGQNFSHAIDTPANEIYQPTPQEKMEMGQIGNNINRAKTADDLVKVQKWLSKMPECSQKTRLQAQLEQKANVIHGTQKPNTYFMDLSYFQDANANGTTSATAPKPKSLEEIKKELANSNMIPILKDYVSNCQTLDEYNQLVRMFQTKKQKNVQYLTQLNTPEDKAIFKELMEIAKDNPSLNVIDSLKFYVTKKNTPAMKEYYKNVIELVKDGKLDSNMLNMYAGSVRDSRIVTDVELLMKAKRENLTPQQVKDLYIPNIEKLTSENIKNIQNGGVFEHDGQLLIKTGNNKVSKLSISKDTYFELFQPGYYVKQRAAGKCYLYSTMISALENPAEKAKMINQCFREQNGVLNVHMPNSKVSIDVDLTNIDGSIQTNPYYSKGSKGVNLLEQAYEKHEVYEQSQKMISFLQTKIADPNSGIDIEKAMVILDDLTKNPATPHYVLKNENALNLESEFNFDDIIHIEDAKNEKGVQSMMARPQDLKTPELFYGVFEGNAGHAAKVFNFGLSPYGSKNSYVKMLLDNPSTGKPQIPDSHLVQFKDLVMTAATRKGGGQVEALMNADLGILSSHAYACSLKMINEKPYMKVINPHNSSSPLLLNLETFRKFFYSITVNNV